MRKHEVGFLHNDAQSKRQKVSPLPPKASLNRSDCNLDFTIEIDGITGSGLHEEGFAYCWSGARANIGIRRGKYCFGCTVLEKQDVTMEETSMDQRNICRVGFSAGDTDVGSLGECLYSFGYGGTGKFSSNGVFNSYGEKFGVGDTIICAVDLENRSNATLSFAKNGVLLGIAKVFDASSFETGLFPHVLLKNVKVKVLLSINDGLVPLDGYKSWDCARDDGNYEIGPSPEKECEVLMMVGLPGSGKTTWAEKWAKQNPGKRYMLLGTNLALDQMKMPGLLRKANYGERFKRLMDLATKIFNKLLEQAAKTPRNYILDQTNVYKSARIRKLKAFKDFRKIAVVVFPGPHELKRRMLVRTKEMGKEVPDNAIHDMLANYVLPNSNEPFDEVRFVELQRHDAERYLIDMKNSIPSKDVKNPETIHMLGSSQDQISRGSYLAIQGMMDCRQPSLNSYQREGSSPNFEEYQQYYTPPSYSRDESLPIIQGNQQYYTTNYSRGGCTRVFQENQHEIAASYSSKHVFPGNHHVYALSNHYVGEKSVQSYSSDHPQPFPPNHPRDQILLPTIYHGNHPSPMVRSAGGAMISPLYGERRGSTMEHQTLSGACTINLPGQSTYSAPEGPHYRY